MSTLKLTIQHAAINESVMFEQDLFIGTLEVEQNAFTEAVEIEHAFITDSVYD